MGRRLRGTIPGHSSSGARKLRGVTPISFFPPASDSAIAMESPGTPLVCNTSSDQGSVGGPLVEKVPFHLSASVLFPFWGMTSGLVLRGATTHARSDWS